MRLFAFLRPCFLSAALLLSAGNAQAEELKDFVVTLTVLPVHYGINQLKVNGVDAVIVRGRFDNGNAWGGDIYTVLVKEKDSEAWRIVRHEQDTSMSAVLTSTSPHTGEDSIRTIRFMTAKDGGLYLLEAAREYKPDVQKTQASFTLSAVQTDPDFGVPYFHKLSKTQPPSLYCNVEAALRHELNIPLPDDGIDYAVCETLGKAEK